MKDKIIELKLALIYEKLLNLDHLTYLEHNEARDVVFTNLREDILELWNSFRCKEKKIKKHKQVEIQQSKH